MRIEELQCQVPPVCYQIEGSFRREGFRNDTGGNFGQVKAGE